MPSRFRMLVISGALALFGVQHLAAQSLELFGGYTMNRMKPEQDINKANMSGWNTSITGYPFGRFGITADFAGFYANVQPTIVGSNGTATTLPAVSLRQYSFMAGPQVRLFKKGRLETSARGLIGGARGYISDSGSTSSAFYGSSDQTSLAALIGSNFDFNINKRMALRFSPGLYITQFGVDETQKNFRFSVGPVFRFGGSGE